MSNWGIVLAAGSGVRMGTPKSFLLLDGKPMIAYSLQAFEASKHVDRVGIVCRGEDLEPIRLLVSSSRFKKVGFVIPGGKERQDSVFEGVQALPKETEIVAVHDSARPLVTVELVDAVMQEGKNKGAALAAVRAKDTIKISQNGVVQETLNRELIWSAQTPQAFKVNLLRKALRQAKEDQFYGTDCASLVERLGVSVQLVEGTYENLKITTASDLLMAEALLKQRLHAAG